jgi:hypothetical protein
MCRVVGRLFLVSCARRDDELHSARKDDLRLHFRTISAHAASSIRVQT